MLVFDDGAFSEDDTTLLTDWLVHTPQEVVAKNFGVSQSALEPLAGIPPEGRFIFQAALPPALPDDAAAMTKVTQRRSSILPWACST